LDVLLKADNPSVSLIHEPQPGGIRLQINVHVPNGMSPAWQRELDNLPDNPLAHRSLTGLTVPQTLTLKQAFETGG
jgi:hypothetical protein